MRGNTLTGLPRCPGSSPKLSWNTDRVLVIDPLPEPASPDAQDDDPREERLAKNEAFFRDANELTVPDGGHWSKRTFICECSRRGCLDRVELTRSEYEHVRAKGTRFFVVPGHENAAVEIVAERFPNYLIVQKTGTAADYADRADPRA